MGAIRSTDADFRYPAALLAAFAGVFVLLGISPWYREDWLLENVLVLVSVAVLILTRHRLRFTNTSYTLLFLFLVLHEIGAHYTYSLVPYEQWVDLDLARNHYDRVIHFAYGLLVLPAASELLRFVGSPRGLWTVALPILFILSQSALYELIEWGAALVFGGDLGTAYVGTQGDEWDAQKDMACAVSGALLSAGALAVAS